MSEGPPKSAVELAMERLRQKDAAAGSEVGPLSDAQKAAIHEARSQCEAKIAEKEILHRSQMAGILEPESRAALDDEHRREVTRLREGLARKVEQIRAGGDGPP